MRFSSSRPVSSPGRTENPPLLMRFLRTKSRSRSRSRSRRPIFFRRKNAAATTETQEPTSPKVTCMGQVRINRSKKPKPGTNRAVGSATDQSHRGRRCGWVKNAFSCHPFTGIIKPTCFSPVWRKWKSFYSVSFSRKSEKRSSSSRSEPIFGRSTVEPEETEKTQKEEEEASSCKSFTATPPRNAFLLTRCRSAPYRSPSLANNNNSFFEDQEEQSSETKQDPFRRHASPGNVLLVPSGDSTTTSVTETTTDERLDDSRRESAASDEPPKRRQCVILTRSNSEPARIGEKLVPELSYRQNRRLGFT
ncbi:PREDICTED: uncharacterized protein LOC104782131 [Camelina sativa]|uniref:Uncharacterized protein LOC104782131 n=1 Tax=Camelina sativa TaxID=90675 RepID=A0ABM0YSL2_CAMSA|nr:PREDICTED: uncharacterized protein LOC104782131 [Camelina sativa]